MDFIEGTAVERGLVGVLRSLHDLLPTVPASSQHDATPSGLLTVAVADYVATTWKSKGEVCAGSSFFMCRLMESHKICSSITRGHGEQPLSPR